MGTRSNGRRSQRASRRGLASFVSFLILFAFALGQSSSLVALAGGSREDPGAKGKKNAVSSDEAPVAEAPAEEAPAETAPLEEAPVADEGSGTSDAGSDPATRSGPDSETPATASADSGAVIQSHGGLHGGDVSLDFVAAGPGTYDHATGLGDRPEFGYDNRTISKTAGVVESLEGGDFACGDLVTFFVQVVIADDAGGSGTVALDMSFGAETTGQPGLGFDSIVSYGINTPDDGNVGNVSDNVVTLNPPAGAIETAGYDELKGTLTVTNLAPDETAIVRVTVHLDCEVGQTPTGNILNAIEGARADGERISVGQQTVPMKQIGGIAAEPAIDVTKDCIGTAAAGEPVDYEITVANTGNVDLSEITVVDDIIGDLSDDFPDTLAVGADVTVTVTYTPEPSDGDPVINTVEATGTYEVNETSDTVSDTDDCSTDITHAPRIDVIKSCPGLVAFGADVTFTITITNTGNEPLTNVTVNDDLLGGDITAAFNLPDPMPVGTTKYSAEFTYTPGADEDPVENAVDVSGIGTDSEAEATADDACVTDISNPAIRIVKTVSEEVVPVGTTVTYTYVITNTGDVTLYDVVVTDDIMGPIGEIAILEPGPENAVTLTKDFEVGTDPVVNIGTAVGEDILGRSVNASDDATVAPIAGENPPPNNPPTPFTGSDAGRLGLITMILFGIGVTVVASTRRRRPEREAA